MATAAEELKKKAAGLYPYNQPYKDIYAGVGKPSSAPENTQALVRQQGVTGSWGAPDAEKPLAAPIKSGAATALAAPAVPTPAPVRSSPAGSSAMIGFMPGTRQAITDGGAEMRDSFGNGQYARGLGQVVGQIPRVANSIVNDAFGGFGNGVSELASGPGQNFVRGALGMTPVAQAEPARPAAAPAPQPSSPAAQAVANPFIDTPPTNAAPAPAPEADATGKVKVTRQPNGTTEFSGKDITGDPQYTGATGFKAGGYGVSSLGGPIAPSAASQVALTNPDGSRWSAQDSAVMAANLRDGIDPYRGTSRQTGQALTDMGGATGGFGILDKNYQQRRTAETALNSVTANKAQVAASAAQLQALDAQDMQRMRETGDTARAAMGNATTAANNKTVNDMARQRLGFDAQRVAIEGQKAASEQLAQGFQLRSSQRKDDAQKVLDDTKATPEQRKLAQSTLAALGGKTAADRVQMVNMPDTVDANGMKISGGQVPIRMNEDGTIEQVPVRAQQQQANGNAPTTQAEYDKLPKGARYTKTDGTSHIKG